MDAARKKRINQVFNVFVAVALVLLMMPVVPGSARVAEAADEANDWQIVETETDTGLVKSLLYDQYGGEGANPVISQEFSDPVLKGLRSVSELPDLDASEDAEEIVDLAVTDAKSKLGEDDVKSSNTQAMTAATDALKTSLSTYLENESSDEPGKTNEVVLKRAAADKWLEDNNETATQAVQAAADSAAEEAAKSAVDALNEEETDSNKTYKYKSVSVELDAGDWDVDDSASSIAIPKGGVSVTNGAITDGSVAVAAEDVRAGSQADYTIKSVESSNESAVKVSDVSSAGYKLQANGLGESTLTYGFAVKPVIAGYTATFGGTCSGSFNELEYTGWKYGKKYSYKYTYTVTTKGTTADSETGEETETEASEDVTISVAAADAPTINAQPGPVYAYALGEAYASITSVNDIPFSGASKEFTLDEEHQLKLQEKEGTVEKKVTVSALFPEMGNVTHELSFTYGDAAKKTGKAPFGYYSFPTAKAKAHAIDLLKSPKVDQSDYIGVVYDTESKTIDVTPKNATSEVESVSLVWSYKDKLTVSQTVQATVAPLEVTYEVDPLAFRVKEDNEKRALEAANKAISEAVAASAKGKDTANPVEGDYFQSIVFDENASENAYDSSGNVAQNTAYVGIPVPNNAYGNYDIKVHDTITINQMGTVNWGETPGLVLLSQNGGEDVTLTPKNAASKWINKIPTAQEDGYGIAYATGGTPTKASDFAVSELSGGDGIHSVEMYDRDSDGVVRRITGVSYKLDTLAPVLTGAEASTPHGKKSVKEGDMLFGRDSVQVELTVVDEQKGDSDSSKDSLEQVRSGVIEKETTVDYHDSEGNQDVKAKLDIDKLDAGAAVYGFTLAENEDVATNSIKVHAVDNAGNDLDTTADKSRDIPISYTRLVAEADAPQLSVSWNNTDVRNGRYYAADRTMTITVTDKFFNYIQEYANDQVVATVSQNGDTVIAVHPSDFKETRKNSNTWTYSLAFTADSDWNVSGVKVTDIIGRSATGAGDTFTIDKVNPTMDVVFDNNNATNGMYYSASRTATITVNEHNFLEGLVDVAPTANAGNGDAAGQPVVGSWTSDGDVRTATVGFPTDGVYTLTVSGVDGANNPLPSYTASEFIVDTTRPTIEIAGVQNYDAVPSGRSAQPNVVVHDTNVSTETSITLEKISYPIADDDANPYTESRSQTATDITVSYPDASESVQNDGVYTLNVQATDMAGNSDSQAVTWSVNRFGSTYVLSDGTKDMVDTYLKPSKVVDVQVTEINPSGYAEEGSTVELTRDTKNTTLELNSDYSLESSGSGWRSYAYDVYKRNFDLDGAYQLLLHSSDLAGNTSENTMKNKDASRSKEASIKFFVDGEEPLCSFIDIASGGVYNETEHTAQVRIEDNMELSRAVIKAGGEDIELSSQDLANSANHEFTLRGSNEKQSVSVVAYDVAGNESEFMSVNDITVTTDPIVLWVNNTPLFVGTIVGGIAVVGAAAALIFVRMRRPSL